MMLGSAAAIAFVPSTDLERSRRFYADTLGLPVEDVSPFACVLRAGPTMLRVTAVESLTPQPFTVFGWTVLDIEATAAALAGAGIEFLRFEGLGQSPDGIWTAPGGDRIAWFHDPDGNVLSLTEFAS
jgi:catechol 2,3-dioxygenase-like lactoylglutathione lyase family enzyme